MHFIKYTSYFLIVSLFFSCKKDKPVEPIDSNFSTSGQFLVLNEGLFQQNNTSLSLINPNSGSVTSNIFLNINQRSLGDTGNEMKKYGSKIYVIVNGSSTLEIMEASNLKSIKQVDMKTTSGNNKQPRSISFSGTKAYITCYDGFVDVLDTNSLNIETRIVVGSNPEKSCVANNKLFVTNSGGLNYPNVDSTVSVIDLNTNQEITKITIGKNPGAIFTAANGQIYVISRGDYGSIPARMHRIDPNSMTKAETYTFDALDIHSYKNNEILVSFFNYNTNQTNISSFNFVSNSIVNGNVLDANQIVSFYGLKYNNANDNIYCFDANSFTNLGIIKVFSPSGNLIQTYNVGLNPNSILFL